MERLLFTRVLELTGGNQSRTAEVLGITRGKVRDRIASFGIHVEKTISMSQPETKSENQLQLSQSVSQESMENE